MSVYYVALPRSPTLDYALLRAFTQNVALYVSRSFAQNRVKSRRIAKNRGENGKQGQRQTDSHYFKKNQHRNTYTYAAVEFQEKAARIAAKANVHGRMPRFLDPSSLFHLHFNPFPLKLRPLPHIFFKTKQNKY